MPSLVAPYRVDNAITHCVLWGSQRVNVSTLSTTNQGRFLSAFLSPPCFRCFHVETTAIKGPQLQPSAPPPSNQRQVGFPSIVSRRPKCAACVSPRRAHLPASPSAPGSNALSLAVAAFSAPPAGSMLAVPLAMEGAVCTAGSTLTHSCFSTPTSEPAERVRGPGMLVTADHAPLQMLTFSPYLWKSQTAG